MTQLDNSMTHILNIVFNQGEGNENRKALIQWLTANVGTRGENWSIAKPRGNRNVCRIRIATKESAALAKLFYSELITPDDRLHKDYLR